MPATRSNSGLMSGLYSALVIYVCPTQSANSLKVGHFVCALAIYSTSGGLANAP